jgi:hypothetical protein
MTMPPPNERRGPASTPNRSKAQDPGKGPDHPVANIPAGTDSPGVPRLPAVLSRDDRGRIIRRLDELRALDRLIRETPVSPEAVVS